jgi:hypothetical protein
MVIASARSKGPRNDSLHLALLRKRVEGQNPIYKAAPRLNQELSINDIHHNTGRLTTNKKQLICESKSYSMFLPKRCLRPQPKPG